MPSQAQQLIDRANALAAGKNGAGNVMPQEWVDVWREVMGFNPEQAQRAHAVASSFAGTQGRAMNAGELEGMISQLFQGFTPPPPAQAPAAPAPVPQAAQGRAFTQPSGGGDISWDVIEQLKNKYGAGQIESMVAEPERYGAQLRNWAQEFNAPTQSPWPWGKQPTAPMERRVQNPWQINPLVWDSLGKTGQELSLSFAEDDGWDANDYQRQIDATRPIGQAPRSVQTQYQQPRRRV